MDSISAEGSGCPVNAGGMSLEGNESRLDPLIRHNPFPFYRAMREEKPVFYDEKLDVYLVTRYADVTAVLRDDVNFSLERGYQERWATGFADELTEILERDGGGFIRDPMLDPPAHTRARKLLEKAFTAHRVQTLEPRIRQIAVDLIEDVADKGKAEARMEIAIPLTARMICDQLGFDFDEVGTERISKWTTALGAQMGRMQTHEEFVDNAKLICELQNYIIPRIEHYRANPADNLTSDLVHARVVVDGEEVSLSFKEQVGWVRGLMTGGNDTTAAGVLNVILVLATQPELARRLRDSIDDDRLLTRFVEEVLRSQPPTHGLFRTAVRDVELSGVVVPKDAQVCVLFASANDDDGVFGCPRDIDLERNNLGRHLSFGAGIHRCVGASLARMEVKVATQEILRRLDNIKLQIPVEDITVLPTLGTHTIDSLPITFTRRA